MEIGLIGLQNSGKTTLFTALTGIEDSYSDINRATVKVPDARLDKLTEMYNPKKQVNAVLDVMDIKGLQVSDDGKVKIPSDFMNRVKNNDALCHIVREFKNDAVAHPQITIDPVRDVEFLETEFLLADMQLVENRLEKIEKDILKSRSDQLKIEKPVFEKLQAHLEGEKPLRVLELDENERKILAGYQFLTLKPLIIGVNLSEDSKENTTKIIAEIKEKLANYQLTVIPFYAKFEMELAELDDDEAEMFMQDFGIEDSALARILQTAYDFLGLQSFFTVGEDECRAWTIKTGNTAQEAAGVIHTDFYNKFIRAEVVAYDDFIELGSMAACKDAGLWRLEGKEYIVKDGDIINVRHS